MNVTHEPYTTFVSLGLLAVMTTCYCLMLLPPSWLHGWRLRAVNLLALLVAAVLILHIGVDQAR